MIQEKLYYKIELFCEEASLWKDWLHSSSTAESELEELRTKRSKLRETYSQIKSRIVLVHEQVIE